MSKTNLIPEQLKYYVRQMQDPSVNSGTRVQYKTILIDIVSQLNAEIADFDKHQVFKQRKQ